MAARTRLNSLSISTRLGWGFGCILLLVLAIALVGQWSLATVQGQLQYIASTSASKTRLVNSLLDSVSAVGLHSRSAAMLTEIDPRQSTEQVGRAGQVLERYARDEASLQQLLGGAGSAPATPAEQQLAADIQAQARKARPEIESALKAITDGDTVSASLGLMTRVAPLEAAWRAQLGKMLELQEQLNTEVVATAEATQQRARYLSILLVVLAIAAGLLIAWRATRSITQPLGRAVVVAERIARGDLTSQVEVRQHDETGRLLEAIAAMQERLRTLVGEISTAADSILVASAEVASGNLDLSQRTEHTSRNLQEAASALGDITHTVTQSADASRQAHGLTSSASDVATRSGDVVSQVVNTMDTISASSHKIGDIISVIDGIAFQTNILALNAAVEAARAGEQGRGFAVVASEVRALAGRSADAAREIKALIQASGTHVSQGSTLVGQAGSTIRELVESVRRVSDIMGEITASAQSQSERIGQVSQSVGELDSMTQQNAALVEESSAAADSLREQAARLTHVVGQFRLSRQPGDGAGSDGRDWQPAALGAASPVPAPQAAVAAPRRPALRAAAAPAPRALTR
ncbi:methyl-accepting chemotaxis protein [Acidovorax sp. Leaf160]|uniref:methyl-accepting chemotaxis protein n=1 Tax=Acidovorax sp. Leaf160 TaxID=1736280 RepID=UPI0006F41A0E|nr:methyl-accepting chemotaxis protein [Acidovorax sp. Leaf160]KQR63042.1 chemotaxis protein [Acidovorax sp. Leaf160]